MPSDIRSFFGGKPAGTPAKAPVKEEKPKKGRPKKKVVDDSDDDVEVPAKKPTPKPAPKPKKVESPKETATTTSDYFGTSGKPKRSEPVKTKASSKTTTPKKDTSSKTPTKAATRSTTATPIRTKSKSSQSAVKIEEEVDNDDDVFKNDFKANGRKDDYEESDEEDVEITQPVKVTKARGSTKSKSVKDEEDFEPDDDVDMKDADDDDFVVPDDEDDVKPRKSAKATPKTSSAKKRKSPPDDDEESEGPKKTQKKATTTSKSPAVKRVKKDEPENAATQAIFDSITKVRPPTPPPRDENKKFNFAAHGQHQNAIAQQETQAEIPVGQENCLVGLKFVFTGVLATLDRKTGQDLVKRYGGKVQASASNQTDFVVLGSEAGPKKLETIKANGLKTIDEFGLFELIEKMPANGGSGKAAAAFQDKKAKEEEKIKKMAAEMEREEKAAAAKAAAAKQKSDGQTVNGTSKRAATAPPVPAGPDSRLWTVRYAPTAINQICGNKGQVEKLQHWLRNFHNAQRKGFKMPGKDGGGQFRAAMIHGPPGIGKTTAAHVVAKAEGFDIVETNASDTRSKKLMEESLRGVLNTNSLLGYFAGDGEDVDVSKKKMVLIMDEVDGMTGSDRGGVGALAKVCRTTNIPMILICNDRRLPKMKPFDNNVFELPFKRPTLDMIRGRMMTIAFKENMKMPVQVLDALIEGTGADIRQVVNMLSTSKLDEEVLDFDKSKAMSKAWEKHVVLKPWDIVAKILGPGMWAASSKATLNEKAELYFNDHEFSYLMLQENYLGTNPTKSQSYSGREKGLKHLELASQAADSISDGDLVDRMIHGSQQQWSLMPTHAMFSFVRPASYIRGSFNGYNSTRFTSWLGQNSKQGKMSRMVKEIQGHMRLRSTGDRHEVRQQYVPALWDRLVNRLQKDGKESIPEVIDLMDSYFLTRDDFDAIQELGVGRMDQEKVKIETQTKATFTRSYNNASHPMPFVKASAVVAPAKVSRAKPDLEEAMDDDEDEGPEPDVNEKPENEEEEIDLKKDKYIKAPKKKAAPKGGAKAKKGKKAANDDEDEEMEDDELKPKKGRGKAKAKS